MDFWTFIGISLNPNIDKKIQLLKLEELRTLIKEPLFDSFLFNLLKRLFFRKTEFYKKGTVDITEPSLSVCLYATLISHKW